MDIGKAVSYISEDEGWPGKIGLGAVVVMIPVLNFAAVGYEAQVIRNVQRGEARPLPSWAELGRMFTDGLWLGLARWVYSLPFVALLCLPLAAFVGLIVASDSDRQIERGLPLALLLGACFFLALLAYGFTLGFVFPAVTAQYVRRGTFGACFDLVAVLGFIRDNLSDYLAAWAGQIAIGIMIGAVISPLAGALAIIPCLGWMAYALLLGGMSFSILLMSGHLVGQLLRADAARPGAPALPS